MAPRILFDANGLLYVRFCVWNKHMITEFMNKITHENNHYSNRTVVSIATYKEAQADDKHIT